MHFTARHCRDFQGFISSLKMCKSWGFWFCDISMIFRTFFNVTFLTQITQPSIIRYNYVLTLITDCRKCRTEIWSLMVTIYLTLKCCTLETRSLLVVNWMHSGPFSSFKISAIFVWLLLKFVHFNFFRLFFTYGRNWSYFLSCTYHVFTVFTATFSITKRVGLENRPNHNA